MELGKAIKKVRKNRGHSQKEVVGKFYSQSAYSKFEANSSDLPASIYLKILENLNLGSEEFIYLKNSYQYDEAQLIENNFFSLSYNNPLDIRKMQEQIDRFTQNNHNVLVEDISTICKALIVLNDSGNIESARSIVTPVWNRLSHHHEWYMSDIKLINVILYFFPVDTAIEVTNRVIKRLEQYQGFSDSHKLTISFKLNLSLLLIKEENFQNALLLLENVCESMKKTMSYQSLAVCFLRISICKNNLIQEGSELYFEKALALVQLYEDVAFEEALKKEHKAYTKQKVS